MNNFSFIEGAGTTFCLKPGFDVEVEVNFLLR